MKHFYLIIFLPALMVILIFITSGATSLPGQSLTEKTITISGVINTQNGEPAINFLVKLKTDEQVLDEVVTNQNGEYAVSYTLDAVSTQREIDKAEVFELGEAYPNPIGGVTKSIASNAHFPVRVDAGAAYQIEIYTVDGKLVRRSSHNLTTGEYTISVGMPRATGVYLLRVRGNNVNEVRSITSFGGNGVSIDVNQGIIISKTQENSPFYESDGSEPDIYRLKVVGGEDYYDYETTFEEFGNYEYDVYLESQTGLYTLQTKVIPEQGGSIEPESGTFNYGEYITLTANASNGWQFSGWEGDLSGDQNPDSILVDSDISVTAIFQEAVESPVTILLDTDMKTDVDDAGALYMLMNMADRNECNIAAVLVNNKGDYSAGAVEAMIYHHGSQGIPVGAYKGDRVGRNNDDMGQHYVQIAKNTEEYGHSRVTRDEFPDATEIYRKTLASLPPDQKNIIVSIGHLQNIYYLLTSDPDEYSNLNGFDLVEKKLDHFVVMGGTYPSGREHNFSSRRGRAYTEHVIEILDDLGKEVWLIGWELGDQIRTGSGLAELEKNHPLRIVYDEYRDLRDHPTFDQLAVLTALRDRHHYFQWTRGQISVDRLGQNTWDDDENAHYQYAKIHEDGDGPTADEIAEIILNIMMNNF